MGEFGEVVGDGFERGLLPESPHLDLAHVGLVLFKCFVTYWPLDVALDLNFL